MRVSVANERKHEAREGNNATSRKIDVAASFDARRPVLAGERGGAAPAARDGAVRRLSQATDKNSITHRPITVARAVVPTLRLSGLFHAYGDYLFKPQLVVNR